MGNGFVILPEITGISVLQQLGVDSLMPIAEPQTFFACCLQSAWAHHWRFNADIHQRGSYTHCTAKACGVLHLRHISMPLP
jgi:hypothetical protein